MSELISYINNIIASNEFFSGGLILGVLGAAIAMLRNVPGYLWNWFKRRIVFSITIGQEEAAYEWIQAWLEKHPKAHRMRSRVVEVGNLAYNGPLSPDSEKKKSEEEVVSFNIGPGLYLLSYKNLPLPVQVSREKVEHTGRYRSEIKVWFWKGGQKLANELLKEAKSLVEDNKQNQIDIMSCHDGYWEKSTRKFIRPINSLIFNNELTKNLIDDVERFQNSKDWYISMGIPWRRGYLLYGEPGNGKTSLVTTIAGSFKYDVCLLSLSGKWMSDKDLMRVFQNAPEKSIILIEDIDATFEERKVVDENKLAGITFAGLLNALDGAAAKEGRILFMTTNHKNVLDPALIRPGRADKHFYIGNASKVQAEKMFLRFFPECVEEAKEFAEVFSEEQISMAALQEYFLLRKDDCKAALTEHFELLIKEDKCNNKEKK